MKRILSLILCVMLVLGMMPFSALAEGETPAPEAAVSEPSTPPASESTPTGEVSAEPVNPPAETPAASTPVPSESTEEPKKEEQPTDPGTLPQGEPEALTAEQSMRAALEAGGEVTLSGDVELTDNLTLEDGVTLSLDAYRLTIPSAYRLTVKAGASLIVPEGASLMNQGSLVAEKSDACVILGSFEGNEIVVEATVTDGFATMSTQVTGIVVSGAGGRAGVQVLGTLQMTATVTPTSAANRSVEWSVSDPAVATITTGGLLTGVSAGNVTVYAAAKDGSGVQGELEVKVAEKLVSKISIAIDGNLDGTSVGAGTTVNLVATVSPEGAGTDGVSWKLISGGTKATIDETTGALTGVSAGTVVVRATAKDGSGVYADKTFYVREGLVTEIDISEFNGKDVPVSGTLLLTPKFTPLNASNQTVTWKLGALGGETPDTGMASITTGGLLTGIKVGTVTVRATAKDGSGIVSAPITVNVTAKQVKSITVSSTYAWVAVDGEMEMKATVLPADAGVTGVDWSVDDDTIATIDENGVLLGIQPGKVTVIAAAKDSSGVKGEKTIQVYEYSVKPLGSDIVYGGRSVQLSASFTPSNLTRTTAKWEIREIAALGESEADGQAYAGSAYASITANGLLKATSVTETKLIRVRVSGKDGKPASNYMDVTIKPSVMSVSILDAATSSAVNGTTQYLNMNKSGEKLTLTAKTMPDGPNGALQAVSWTASPSNILQIVASGNNSDANEIIVTGLKSGTATLTARATDGSGIYSSVKIKVDRLVAENGLHISTTLENDKLFSNTSTTLKVSFDDPQPDNRNVTWSLVGDNDKQYASIASNGVLTAKYVTGTQVVTVKAVAKDGSEATDTKEITIIPRAMQLVITDGDNNDVSGAAIVSNLEKEGGQFSFKATVLPGDAQQAVTWSTNDARGVYGVMTVSEDGQSVTLSPGTKPGSVILTATAKDGSNKKIAVKVTYVRYPIALTIVGAPDEMRAGTSVALSTDLATNKNLTNSAVKWTLSGDGASYASISASGQLRTRAVPSALTVRVTATSAVNEAISDSVDIRIVPSVTSIQLTMPDSETSSQVDVTNKTLNIDWAEAEGKQIQLTAQTFPGEAGQAVEWSTNNAQVATVDDSGLVSVTGSRSGTATITAKAKDGSGKTAVVRISLPIATKVLIFQDSTDVTNKTLPIDANDSSASISLVAQAYPAGSKQGFTWSSSNTSVALVDADTGTVTLPDAPKIGTAVITAKSTDGSNRSAKVTVKSSKLIKTITLTAFPDSDELISGKSFQLTWTIDPSDASNKSVVWSLVKASDSRYLTVSTNGRLTAKTITETVDGIEVRAIAADSGIEVYRYTVTLIPGGGTLVLYADGENVTSGVKSVDLTEGSVTLSLMSFDSATKTYVPVDATWWSSSNVVSVVDGTVSATKAARATIKATTVATPKKTVSTTIVFQSEVTDIKIDTMAGLGDGETATAITGKTLALKAVVTPSTATNKAVSWQLDDEGKKYASISSGGVLTAKAGYTEVHTVNVTASAKDGSGKESAPFPVTIYPAVTSVRILHGSDYVTGSTLTYNISSAEALTLTAEAAPAQAQTKVKWTSSNPAIATIDASGVVTLVGNRTGVVKFTATAADGSNKYAFVNVRFVQYVTGITVERYDGGTELSVKPGMTLRLKAAIEPTDATNKSVNWTIIATEGGLTAAQARAFATINSSTGLITAKKVTAQTADVEITVQAEAKDGSGVTGTAKITITYAG